MHCIRALGTNHRAVIQRWTSIEVAGTGTGDDRCMSGCHIERRTRVFLRQRVLTAFMQGTREWHTILALFLL